MPAGETYIHEGLKQVGFIHSSSCNQHILCSHPLGNDLFHKKIDCTPQSVMLKSFWLPE